MKAVSLFSSAGIGESRLHELEIEVVAALEIEPDRAALYSQLNPDASMICGDIRNESVFNSFLKAAGEGIDLLLATPPCQGVSIAGKNRSNSAKSEDSRNHLIFQTIEAIKRLNPKYVLIENVPQYLDLVLEFENRFWTVPELLIHLVGDTYTVNASIENAAQYGVPQYRKRAFIKLAKLGSEWEKPVPTDKLISLEEAIGHLPSLEAGQRSEIPWHFARKHDPRHVIWMQNTPPGKSALSNPEHFPVKASGEKIKAFNTTYKRLDWGAPAKSITMRNDAISSQANVHPGRRKRGGIYSDARVLTPLELMIINSMIPEQFNNLKVSEGLLRKVIGESVPPLLLNAQLIGLPK